MVYYPQKIFNLDKEKPLVFLAGPIQDAFPWHYIAIEYLKKYSPYIDIACPKRPKKLDTKFVYEEQVDWESIYLQRASENGGILFWLGNQDTKNPERSYAQTTRFELAEWFTNFKSDSNINIVVGIDSKFPGERYIRYRISKEAPEIKITNSLDFACLQLIKKIYK